MEAWFCQSFAAGIRHQRWTPETAARQNGCGYLYDYLKMPDEGAVAAGSKQRERISEAQGEHVPRFSFRNS
jgi:hypothetical protein